MVFLVVMHKSMLDKVRCVWGKKNECQFFTFHSNMLTKIQTRHFQIFFFFWVLITGLGGPACCAVSTTGLCARICHGQDRQVAFGRYILSFECRVQVGWIFLIFFVCWLVLFFFLSLFHSLCLIVIVLNLLNPVCHTTLNPHNFYKYGV